MPNPTQISLLNYHFEAAACDAVLTVMLNKSDRDYSTPDELNHATELTQFSYEEIRDALNELHRSNSTLEELENAAHMALAKFMVILMRKSGSGISRTEVADLGAVTLTAVLLSVPYTLMR